jgi:hypothetical protein
MPWRKHRAPIDWDSQPLGTVPDPVLARQLDCSPSAVTRARRLREIPPAPLETHADKRTPPQIDWDTQPLGEMTDVDLGHKLGVDPSTVWRHRRRRNIAPFATPEQHTSAWDNLAANLGDAPDPHLVQTIAAATGTNSSGVYRRLKARGITTAQAETKKRTALTDWSAIDWSKSDSQLHRDTGINRDTLSRHRPR